jgi:hypothetical protein
VATPVPAIVNIVPGANGAVDEGDLVAVTDRFPVPVTVTDNICDCVGAADTDGDMIVGDGLPVPVADIVPVPVPVAVADAITAHR